MTTAPAIWPNNSALRKNRLPMVEAVNPRIRNTVDSPITKNSAGTMVRRRCVPDVISCIDTPPI